MAAPKGNKFWKNRSKHGRSKLFETPELLWEEACKYFDWCDNNPLKKQQLFNNKGKIVKSDSNLMRAYTMAGLCFYLKCNEAYLRTFKKQLPENEEDFNTVITDIEKVVFRQKFEGAAAGLLNANIIARDLGLSDKQDIKNNHSGEMKVSHRNIETTEEDGTSDSIE